MGGPDVDARLELMHRLKDTFTLAAAGSAPELRERFSVAGFDYHSYPLTRYASPLRDLITTLKLLALFRKLDVQVVHAFDTKPGVWGCLAARLAGVTVIVGTVTGFGGSLGDVKGFGPRVILFVYKKLQKLACAASDLTIFQNQHDAREFISARFVPRQKSVVILGSGVDTAVFDPARVTESARTMLKEQLGIQPGCIIVTMISRVIRSKGVMEFATAARRIRDRNPRIRFLLVGSEDQGSIDALTALEASQLKSSVTWPGPSRDIRSVLGISDLFILPSTYREGIPRVLLEAASMGLPIITTDSPGCNEVVEDGVNGFLVPDRDSNALAEAILRLATEPETRRRMGRASRQKALDLFDLSRIADQTRSVYRRLLNHRQKLSAISSAVREEKEPHREPSL